MPAAVLLALVIVKTAHAEPMYWSIAVKPASISRLCRSRPKRSVQARQHSRRSTDSCAVFNTSSRATHGARPCRLDTIFLRGLI